MNAAQGGLRQSALLLYAMPVKDRNWVLSGLSEGHRESLCALLEELKELGMPSDKSLLQQVAQAGVPAENGAVYGFDALSARRGAVSEFENMIEILHFANLDLLAKALQSEPDLLIVRFLRLHAWPWEAEFMKRLPSLKQRNVSDRLGKPEWAAPGRGAVDPTRETRFNAMLLSAVIGRMSALESAFVSDRSPSMPPSRPKDAKFKRFRQRFLGAFKRTH